MTELRDFRKELGCDSVETRRHGDVRWVWIWREVEDRSFSIVLCCWDFEGSKEQNRKIVGFFFVVNFESPLEKEEEEKVIDVFGVSSEAKPRINPF